MGNFPTCSDMVTKTFYGKHVWKGRGSSMRGVGMGRDLLA